MAEGRASVLYHGNETRREELGRGDAILEPIFLDESPIQRIAFMTDVRYIEIERSALQALELECAAFARALARVALARARGMNRTPDEPASKIMVWGEGDACDFGSGVAALTRALSRHGRVECVERDAGSTSEELLRKLMLAERRADRVLLVADRSGPTAIVGS